MLLHIATIQDLWGLRPMVGKFQVLESQPSSGDSVRQALISAAPQQVNWTRLEPDNGSVDGPMIMVGQECKTYENFVGVDVTDEG